MIFMRLLTGLDQCRVRQTPSVQLSISLYFQLYNVQSSHLPLNGLTTELNSLAVTLSLWVP